MWTRALLRQFKRIGSSKLQIPNETRVFPFFQLCRLYSVKNDTEWVKLNPSTQEQPYTLTEEQENIITQGDLEKQLKLKELLLKLYIRHQEGTELPDSVKLESFEVMLSSGSNQLTRTLKYLLKNRRAEQKQLLQKEEDRLQLQVLRAKRLELPAESSWMDYRINENCLFLKIYQRSMAVKFNSNALLGLQFGQKIIFDCSLESTMWERELRQTVKQILLCYDEGRRKRRPFSLHLCNFNFDGKLMHYLKVQRPDVLDLAIGFHKESYLDIFERKNLVYVDQRASKKLVYNPEDIYILRAVVDRPGTAPGAERMALKEKIKCASLPLADYVTWKPKAQRHLCLHQYHNILMDVKDYGNWPKAVEAHLPKSRFLSVKYNNTPPKRTHQKGRDSEIDAYFN